MNRRRGASFGFVVLLLFVLAFMALSGPDENSEAGRIASGTAPVESTVIDNTVVDDTPLGSHQTDTTRPPAEGFEFEMTECPILYTPDRDRSWFVVNDGVMGGLSEGSVRVEEGVLIFEGEINTDGGGFSSIRFPLEPGELDEAVELSLFVRTDGRQYTLTADDSLDGRDRRISFWGDLEVGTANEDGWATASVDIADMTPRVFGREVEDEAFRNDLAIEVGIILADGVDGPFRLEISSLTQCPDIPVASG